MKKNRAESKVRKFLKTQGFTLNKQQDQTQSGVDVVAMKDGIVRLIEVKKAVLHNRAYQVDPVSKKQSVVCDTIAIVTPHGILIEPMSQHLQLVGKTGVRYLTEMVHLMGLVK
jgi:HJR/Mrr/RecB family endonuclease